MRSRTRVEIIRMILESARTSTTKTEIMYKTYLAHSRLTKYVEILQAKCLLEYDQEKRLYRTTKKGIKFLNTTDEINGSMTTKLNSQNLREGISKDKRTFSEPRSFYN